jgi:hypothetical protein
MKTKNGTYFPMMVLNTPVVPTSVQSQLELLSQCNAELQKELGQNGGMKQASVSLYQVHLAMNGVQTHNL